ncbi:geranylgeranyl diphosphate synthase type I [Streptomyces sp. CEV 2-1]|nr:geranylgeranyl diphosphate synthase type I [Streptomyces sp. CEV 2-1]
MLRSRAKGQSFSQDHPRSETEAMDGAAHAGRGRYPVHDGAGPPHGAIGLVDQDVAGAVLRTARAVLCEKLDQAYAIDAVFSRDVAERLAGFTLGGGSRMRSQFIWWGMRATTAGSQAVDVEPALRLGVAVELVQTCALVQDDVMDGSSLRRGRPAVHVDFAESPGLSCGPKLRDSFGRSAAVLLGDLALAWADDTVAETTMRPATRQRVSAVWQAMRTEMVAGQYLDLHGQVTGTRSEARALRTAYLKSALYSVARPLALGAALAGAAADATRALSAAGRCAGLAFQIRDDLLGVFGDPGKTGKPSGGDIREGKPTCLMAVARSRAGTSRARAVLDDALGRADLSDETLTDVRDVLVTTGACAEMEDRADRLMKHAARHLAEAAVEPYAGNRLLGLFESVTGAGTTPSAEARAEPGPALPTGPSSRSGATGPAEGGTAR